MAIKVIVDPKLKKPWTSKTAVLAVISAVLPFFCPPLVEWIKDNPTIYSSVISMLFLALRAVTNGKVTIG